MKDSTGRFVWDVEVTGSGVDAYVESATYDDATSVPDDELDYLTDNYPEYVAEAAFDMAIMRAEALSEGDR